MPGVWDAGKQKPECESTLEAGLSEAPCALAPGLPLSSGTLPFSSVARDEAVQRGQRPERSRELSQAGAPANQGQTGCGCAPFLLLLASASSLSSTDNWAELRKKDSLSHLFRTQSVFSLRIQLLKGSVLFEQC